MSDSAIIIALLFALVCSSTVIVVLVSLLLREAKRFTRPPMIERDFTGQPIRSPHSGYMWPLAQGPYQPKGDRPNMTPPKESAGIPTSEEVAREWETWAGNNGAEVDPGSIMVNGEPLERGE